MSTMSISKKHTATLICIFGTFFLAYFEKMTGDVAAVIAVAIGSYNYVQGKIDEIKSSK